MVHVEEKESEDSDNGAQNVNEGDIAQPQRTTFENMEIGGGNSSALSDLAIWQ